MDGSVPTNEIREEFQSDLTGFFGVELRCRHIVSSHHGGESGSGVFRCADYVRRICRCGIVGVDEVEIALIRDTGKERVRAQLFCLIPSDLRNFVGVRTGLESFRGAAEDSEAGSPPILFGGFKEDLRSEADSKEGDAGGNAFAKKSGKVQAGEILHSGTGGADTREEDMICEADPFRIGGHLDGGPDGLEGEADARQIAGMVVNNRDHTRVISVSSRVVRFLTRAFPEATSSGPRKTAEVAVSPAAAKNAFGFCGWS